MKLLKWLLPVVLINLFSTTSFSQINLNDSTAVLELRDNLGLTAVAGVSSNIISTWIPNYIDTTFDIVTQTFKIRTINFDNLVPAPAVTTTILPDSIITDTELNLLEFMTLNDNGIDLIEGQLYAGTGPIPPALKGLNLENNTIANNTDFFVFLLQGMENLEELRANNALISLGTPLNNYTIPTTDSLKNLNISDNGFSGTLNLADLLSNFQSLLSLDANDNAFSSLVSPTFPVILERLSVEDNLFQDFKPFEEFLNIADSIQFLYAENAMDTATVQDSLEFAITSPLTKLKVLDISNNFLRGVIPADMVERLPNIVELYLNNNKIRGKLPQPTGVIGAPINSNGYLGFDNLEELNLSNNELEGELRIDWLFGNQLYNLIISSGLDSMPLEEFYISGNQFSSVKPTLNNPIANVFLTNSNLSNRFSEVANLEIHDNNFNFRSLFTIKRIFNLIQAQGIVDHYIPQDGVDSSSFVYAPQGDIGIGGIRRRVPGSRILFSAGLGIVAQEQTQTNYLTNKYTWERIDTAGLIGGTPTSPITQILGFTEQSGGTTAINIGINNIIGIPSFIFGVDTTAENTHRLEIPSADLLIHGNWLYRAQIKNDSFPSLTLFSKRKKLEIGFCTDSSGARIFCQSMIVQFDPDSLSQLSTAAQRDSFKTALRSDLGVELIEQCLCGDIELWSLPDSSSAMLESNGKGTKRAATTASAKPQLLSADPNYPLLGNSSNPNSNNPSLPTGSGNTTAKTLVAIIDSGVDYDYPALTSYISEGTSSISNCLPNATFGYNFLDDNNNAIDDHGHGTSVAGIVAGISQQSILPDTGSLQTDIGILPLKYTNKEGSGTLFHAACALRYAADYERTTSTGDIAKVRVINASWGYYGDPCVLLENAIEYAGEECDILIVASAGNDSIQVHGSLDVRHWPSNSIWDPLDVIPTDNILSVAGLTPNGAFLDLRSNYSNIHIDLAAPWSDVTPLAGSTNNFHTVGGTSFAAPQVSRAAALLFDKYPDASYFAVKHALINGVDILPSDDSTKLVSGGKINYAKADSILNRITNKTDCSPNMLVNTKKIEALDNQIKIYPNPVADVLTLEFNYDLTVNNIELRMFNVSGQEVKRQTLPSNTTNTNINTDNLSPGVYFIQLTVDEQQYSQKVIKF